MYLNLYSWVYIKVIDLPTQHWFGPIWINSFFCKKSFDPDFDIQEIFLGFLGVVCRHSSSNFYIM